VRHKAEPPLSRLRVLSMVRLTVLSRPPAPKLGYLVFDPINARGPLLPGKLCVPVSMEKMRNALPLLVSVDSMQDGEREAINQMAMSELREEYPPYLCSWFGSEVSLDEVSGHMAQCLHVRSGHDSVYWRWFDPRVFVVAAHVMDEDQIDSLLGPIDEWHFPWLGEWWCLARSGTVPMITAQIRAVPREDQWHMLTCSARITTVIGRIRTSDLAPESKLSLLAKTIELFEEAQSVYRIQKQDDQIDFATYGLRFGHHFFTHHRLVDVWGDFASGVICWSEFISHLSDDVLRQLEARERGQ